MAKLYLCIEIDQLADDDVQEDVAQDVEEALKATFPHTDISVEIAEYQG